MSRLFSLKEYTRLMEVLDALNTDLAKLPQWVQIWLDVLMPIILLSALVLLFNKSTRNIATVAIVLLILGIAGVIFLYSQMGMVKLLGLGHVIFWGPLLAILINRLRGNPPTGFFKAAMIILTIGIAAILVFDVADVVRWVAGERGLIV